MKKIVLLTLCFSVFAFVNAKSVMPGDSAFMFTLNDENGVSHSISEYANKKFVVLIFYPGDATPVCTQQLCEIRDEYSVFTENDAVVFGVNPASDKSHKKFSTNNKFQFPLLIDEKMSVAKAYGVKGALMNQRAVFVIGKDGKIVFAKMGKPPVSEILQSFKVVPDSLNILQK